MCPILTLAFHAASTQQKLALAGTGRSEPSIGRAVRNKPRPVSHDSDVAPSLCKFMCVKLIEIGFQLPPWLYPWLITTMLARIKSLFHIPPPTPTRFVPPDQLTTFQRESWHRSAPIILTESKMEALVIFFARSLNARWSLVEEGQEDNGAGRYVVLLEAETDAGLLKIFRALANSSASARLSRR